MEEFAALLICASVIVVPLILFIAFAGRAREQTRPGFHDNRASAPEYINNLGQAVKYWRGTIANYGTHKDALLDALVKELRGLGYSQVSIYWSIFGQWLGQKRRVLVVRRRIGTLAFSTVGVRLDAENKRDLQVEWQHFEGNMLTGAARVIFGVTTGYLGLVVACAGLLVFPPVAALGGLMVLAGFMPSMLSQVSGYQKADSDAFCDAVLGSLWRAFDSVGITSGDVQRIEGTWVYPKSQKVTTPPKKATPSASKKQPETSASEKVCSVCDRVNAASAVTCVQCGSSLT